MRRIFHFVSLLSIVSGQVTAHLSSESGRGLQSAYQDWVLLEDYLYDENLSGLGFSVASSSDGQIAAYGSPYADGNTGAVGVYKYDPKDGWVQMGEDITGFETDDYFGENVALTYNGEILVASAPRALDDRGYARIFRFDNPTNSWEQIGKKIEGKEKLEEFGFSVAISQRGNYVVFGAPSKAVDGGSVRVYEYNGLDKENEWKQVGSDITHGDSNVDQFGHTVDIVEDEDVFVAIGAPNEIGGKGSVGIFMLDPGRRQWDQFGGYIDGNVKGTRFGQSVSLAQYENLLILAVGFPGPGIDGESPILSGAEVYSMNRDTRQFNYYGHAIYPSEKEDETGYRVSLSEDGQTLAVSSPAYGRRNGMIRVYKYNKDEGERGMYEKVGNDLIGDDYDELGFSLSLSRDGEVVTAGSPDQRYVVMYLSPGSEMTKFQSSNRSAFSIVLLTFSLVGLAVLIGFIVFRGARFVKTKNESGVEFTSIAPSNDSQARRSQTTSSFPVQGQDVRAPVPVPDHDSDDDVSEGSYDEEDMDYETHLRKIS